MRYILVALLSLLLAACGGGGGGSSDSSSQTDAGDITGSSSQTDGGDTSAGQDTGGDTTTPPADGGTPVADTGYALLAWNDLGMHCMDSDYSVFSILPPYNNLHAQLVQKSSGAIVTTGVTLRYAALADPAGSINSTSAGKTNFWSYVGALYGASPPVDTGLTGNPAPSAQPAALAYSPASREFVADGIPMTPYDDSLAKNFYPLVNVTATDGSGKQLASARVVLPISDEMSCLSCHASRKLGTAAQMAAQPADGWVFDTDPDRDYRRNILRLHDQKSAGSTTFYNALVAMNYSTAGLLPTADAGTPVLCAGCHASNALPGTGIDGIAPLTEAMHGFHANVVDPGNSLSLNMSANRGACYQCHPGSQTKCLRGAMGSALDAQGELAMQCQDCHGTMGTVGQNGRVGWLQEPLCQACHHDGMRQFSALNASQMPRGFGEVADQRFATNPDTPAAGVSLYRMSEGHGGLQCEACHGATHAIYPSSHINDNLLAQDLQGHAGTLRDCGVCHEATPFTMTGGPHGMHTIGQAWVNNHEPSDSQLSQCAYCHGADFRGSPLSAVKADVSFERTGGRTADYKAGQQVTCYDCHNGPYEG